MSRQIHKCPNCKTEFYYRDTGVDIVKMPQETIPSKEEHEYISYTKTDLLTGCIYQYCVLCKKFHLITNQQKGYIERN